MARPKKDFDQVRGRPLGVRLTPEERAQINELATAHGITAAEFMRRRSLGHRLPPVEQEARLATALMRIGVNLNQLTRHANEGRGLPAAPLYQLLGRINAAMDEIYGPGPDQERPQL
jgi:hypothetical protein